MDLEEFIDWLSADGAFELVKEWAAAYLASGRGSIPGNREARVLLSEGGEG